jgi:hypothetical protein
MSRAITLLSLHGFMAWKRIIYINNYYRPFSRHYSVIHNRFLKSKVEECWPFRPDASTVKREALTGISLKARLHGSTALNNAVARWTTRLRVEQRGWNNQSEPCKQYLSTKVINGIETSCRRPTFVQRRWFTLVICDYDPCLHTTDYCVTSCATV